MCHAAPRARLQVCRDAPASTCPVARPSPFAATILFTVLLATLSACDHGLVPPDEPPAGTLIVDVHYAGHPESWPEADELHDLRFVAMRFVPQDTSDFFQLNRMVISNRLDYNVPQQTVVLEAVQATPYPYAGVAQQYGSGTFDWRPIGLVEDNGGVIILAPNETTRVSVTADFLDPPPFPPPQDG